MQGTGGTAGTGGSQASSTAGTGATGSTTGTDTGSTTSTVDPLGPWTFESATVDGLAPVWGGLVAQESATIAYLAGGVGGTSGPVTTKLVKVERGASGLTATLVTDKLTSRFCGCAMVDAKRGELVAIGGRNKLFEETPNAELVDLKTGAISPLDVGSAAVHAVGCHAVFLADRDEGYVFGGAAQGAGFTASTWRYTPADHKMTLLDGAGPPARYDGVLRYPADGGPVWLLAGMGVEGGKVKFYSDVWNLDPVAGVWKEVTVSGAAPPGRRFPWVAFSGDKSTIVMGFGSDSPQGTTLIGDLWRLDVGAGTWAEVPRTGDVMPGARGFAGWLPGPEGSAGLLSGGIGDKGIAKEALILHPPVTSGDWR